MLNYNFALTQFEEVALANCINIADELYKTLKKPTIGYFDEYEAHFRSALLEIEQIYNDEIIRFAGGRMFCVSVDDNYKYARIIKNGLLILKHVHFFDCTEMLSFIKNINMVLSCANIVVALSFEKYATHYSYFSYQYDILQQFVSEISFYLKSEGVSCDRGSID